MQIGPYCSIFKFDPKNSIYKVAQKYNNIIFYYCIKTKIFKNKGNLRII
jgi:hypothetical protein